MMTRGVAIASGVALALAPGAASAICGQPPPVDVWPHHDSGAAPTNTRVVIAMARGWRRGATLSLRTAPLPGKPRAPIAATERAWTTTDVERATLVPDAPLAPRTAYELWTSRGEIVGLFTTGDAPDTTPPTFRGVEGARVLERTGPIECGLPRLVANGKALATDDRTEQRDILYAVWAEPGAIDYTKPPRGWTTAEDDRRGRGFTLTYGSTEQGDDDLDLPAKRPLRIGIRAIDLAGNASAPSEVTVR
jgi:hypothetical protein